MKLKGRIVLVTGGNSGIGRAIAVRAAAEGGRVAIAGRDPAKGAGVLAELQAAGAEAAALEFRTQENGEWSSNWISDRIQPGDTFNMDFGTSKGDCSVRTQISFDDGSKFDAPVDYCKVTNLYIHNDSITWD